MQPAKLFTALLTTLYCTGFNSAVLADDIDIFFGGAEGSSQSRPNVLFILDDSGSMDWKLTSNNDAAGTAADPSRLMVLQDAFEQIMGQANNINAGLMQLHGHGTGGSRYAYPVTNIDQEVAADSIGVIPALPTLTNDAHEINGSVTLDASQLTLKKETDLADTPWVALRFTDIPVPKGATIDSAVLSLGANHDASNALIMEIRAENSGNSAVLNNNNSSISSKATHNAIVPWVSEPGLWTRNDSALSPDLSPLISQVTSHADWCGNNSLTLLMRATAGNGVRSFHSMEGDGQAPQLTIKYSGGEGGCINQYISQRIQEKRDDVEQRSNKNEMTFNSSDLDIYTTSDHRYRAGLRFTNLPIKQGATILDARLNLELYDDSVSNTLRIKVQNHDNAPGFTGNTHDLYNRYNGGYGHTNWSIPSGLDEDSWVTSPDISSQVQQLVNRSGWQSKNALGIVLQATNSNRLSFSTFNAGSGRAPQLVIKVAHGGLETPTAYTVRNKLVDLVKSMNASSGTPIVPTLWNATQYYKDDLSGDWASPISNACQPNHIVLLTDGQANGNNSTTKDAINALSGVSNCTSDSSDSDEDCGRSLSNWLGKSDLSSTIEETNSVTLHTIGFAMGANSQAKSFMRDLAQENQGCTDAEMTAWEANPNDDSLKNCGFYLSDNASSLVSAFARIFDSINSVDATFVSPGATVNQFNRSQHKNELYFSLFQPKGTQAWPGNLKRYALFGETTASVGVVDVIGSTAVDPNTGYFKDDAQSFWSATTDGSETAKGGMASRLPAPADRQVLTLINGQISAISNATNAMFGLGDTSADDDKRQVLINWAQGLNEAGEARNAIGDPLHSRPAVATYSCSEWEDNTTKRACKAPSGSNLNRTEYTDSTLLFGTNEGFLHAINTQAQSGQEQFAFIPPELLPNLEAWKNNPSISSNRTYGLDGSATLWVNDRNKNGVIYGGRNTVLDAENTVLREDEVNPGEFVYAYIGMRRGGRNYHALDITNPENPSYKWGIKGGTGLFTRLGQSWSRPIKTRVNIDGTVKDVLFISGGYDEGQDQDSLQDQNSYKGGYKSNDTMGNAVYMIDALTGDLLWSASAPNDPGRNIAVNPDDPSAGTVPNHNLLLDRMTYSIPGNIRAIDLYGDGLADQLFFADVGGQVWRLYINNGEALNNLVWPADSNNDGIASQTDGVMAYLGYSNSSATNADGTTNWDVVKRDSRRFYHEPDIAVFRKNGSRYLAVSIGSGFHADPMGKRNNSIQNNFYMLSTTALYNPNLDYSTVRTNKTVPAQRIIQHGDSTLVDMTNDLTGDPIGSDPVNYTGGWYIQLEADELVSAPAISQDGTIYFNSFQKNSQTNSCDASNGIGRAYKVQTINGGPAEDDSNSAGGDGGGGDAGNVTGPGGDDWIRCRSQNRCSKLKSPGIPPETIILRPSEKYQVTCVGAECEADERQAEYGRTFWREVE